MDLEQFSSIESENASNAKEFLIPCIRKPISERVLDGSDVRIYASKRDQVSTQAPVDYFQCVAKFWPRFAFIKL